MITPQEVRAQILGDIQSTPARYWSASFSFPDESGIWFVYASFPSLPESTLDWSVYVGFGQVVLGARYPWLRRGDELLYLRRWKGHHDQRTRREVKLLTKRLVAAIPDREALQAIVDEVMMEQGL